MSKALYPVSCLMSSGLLVLLASIVAQTLLDFLVQSLIDALIEQTRSFLV